MDMDWKLLSPLLIWCLHVQLNLSTCDFINIQDKTLITDLLRIDECCIRLTILHSSMILSWSRDVRQRHVPKTEEKKNKRKFSTVP